MVTVNEHVGPAVLVQFTVVVPTGKNEPDAGVQVIVPQSPVGVGRGYVTTAPHWFGSFVWVTLAGQVMAVQPAGAITLSANGPLELLKPSTTMK